MWLKNIFEDFSTALDATDARNSVAAWNMPMQFRVPAAAGIGAARVKRSKADSPTATAGSRAAQIKKQ